MVVLNTILNIFREEVCGSSDGMHLSSRAVVATPPPSVVAGPSASALLLPSSGNCSSITPSFIYPCASQHRK